MKEITQAKFSLVGLGMVVLLVAGWWYIGTGEQREAKRMIEASNKSERLQEQVAIEQRQRETAGRLQRIRNESNKRKKYQAQQVEVEAMMKMDNTIAMWRSEGLLYSIDVEYNEARVAPSVWFSFTLENKQLLVRCLSKYFDMKGSTARVTVRSSRNDEKLATYGSWGGLKILK